MGAEDRIVDIADEAEAIAHGHRFLTVLVGDLNDPVTAAELREFLDRIGFGHEVEVDDQSRQHVTFRIMGPHAIVIQGDLIDIARHVNPRWRLQDTMRPVESART